MYQAQKVIDWTSLILILLSGEAHAPCGCSQWQEWQMKIAEVKPEELKASCSGTEDAANCLWLVTNSKPCPNCKSPIQKNEGCNHMKCSKVSLHLSSMFLFSTVFSLFSYSSSFSSLLQQICWIILLFIAKFVIAYNVFSLTSSVNLTFVGSAKNRGNDTVQQQVVTSGATDLKLFTKLMKNKEAWLLKP